MTNNVAYKIVEIDIIQIKMHNNIVKTLTNIRHVLNLKKKIDFFKYILFQWMHI